MDKTLTLRVDTKLHYDIKVHIAKQNITLKDYLINLIKLDLYKASLQAANQEEL